MTTTTTKLPRLTPQQEARMSEWRDRWIASGLRTGPANRERVRSAVDSAVHSAVRSAVRSVVGSAVHSAVHSAVGSVVGSAVHSAVGLAVRSAVRSAVGSAVRSADGAADPNVLRAYCDTLSRVWHQIFGGQFWVGYGYYGYWASACTVSFYRDVCGLTLGPYVDEMIAAIIGLSESCCWVWPNRDFVMLCERPKTLVRDEAGRLHCENAPAVSWEDGWGVYAWHGVQVPADIILEPSGITTERIEAEENAERRRVMLERFGFGRYVEEVGFEVLDKDKDMLGAPRRLLRKPPRPNSEDEPLVLIELTNSSPELDGHHKLYHLRVHPELRPLLDDGKLGASQAMTCQNAVASTFGLRGDKYQLMVET